MTRVPPVPNCPLPSMGSQTGQSRCPLKGLGPPQAQQRFINNSQPPLCSSDKGKRRECRPQKPWNPGEKRGEMGREKGREERAARAREGSREKASEKRKQDESDLE